MNTGYADANYAYAFAAHGTPRYLPHAQGWLLQRSIPETEFSDAMGCYPFFSCRNWHKLAEDFEKIKSELVSLTLVTDPFGDFEASNLQTIFPDFFQPYKEHFIIDLRQNPAASFHPHHRRNIRAALKNVTVEFCEPTIALKQWIPLYNQLIARHNITGLATFSPASFATQWLIPSLRIMRATHKGETVGMALWFMQEDRVYYHLAAYSPRGYELKASYALFQFAINYFTKQGLNWLALGAGAGIHNDGNDGLTRFKRGWATGTRTVYLCGKIFNPSAYEKLAQQCSNSANSFFPAYRAPQIARSQTA